MLAVTEALQNMCFSIRKEENRCQRYKQLPDVIEQCFTRSSCRIENNTRRRKCLWWSVIGMKHSTCAHHNAVFRPEEKNKRRNSLGISYCTERNILKTEYGGGASFARIIITQCNLSHHPTLYVQDRLMSITD